MSETLPNTKKQLPRQLRERKQRKLYSDEWALGDDDVEGGRGFSLADKLESQRFDHPGSIHEMFGTELTVSYLQKNGFTTPLLFKEKTGLGLSFSAERERGEPLRAIAVRSRGRRVK
ncbi:hypothetical protein MSG28_005824 [Choristoneura fumiferana]|uniref:Uncharacterized protein n=1 Tax=Choristoneura fumiferana TaxID=7141 RepID=A0ACC0L0X2_CHOFU|nr:hypothetical protein MSG28_005824 [Choristoneura fumiferana]